MQPETFSKASLSFFSSLFPMRKGKLKPNPDLGWGWFIPHTPPLDGGEPLMSEHVALEHGRRWASQRCSRMLQSLVGLAELQHERRDPQDWLWQGSEMGKWSPSCQPP